MNNNIAMFKDIIPRLNIFEVPIKYIVAACHIDQYGMENVVTGDELDLLMALKFPYENANQINILIDIRIIDADVSVEVEKIFKYIDEKIREQL